MVRYCRFFPERRCYHSSCDFLSSLGDVEVCPLYSGGNKFRERRAGGSPVSIHTLLKGRVKV